MSNLALANYDLCARRGFLSAFDPDQIALPGVLEEARTVARDLPKLLPSGRIRQLLEQRLPKGDVQAWTTSCSTAQARVAMVHYTFLVQAFVWGEPKPPLQLPACLAQPLVALAELVRQQPLLTYRNYVLDNWGLLDSMGAIELSNIFMRQPFLGGQDEAWFVMVHVAIEAQAGQALALVGPVISAARQGDTQQLRALLEQLAEAWLHINQIFDRMPERCDPYIYFERVRPYIHGWQDNPALPNGIIYEGVSKYAGKPQAFRGQTGSQSSIVPTMDALLGIGHAADPLKAYLDQLHAYRPPLHRQFIDDVKSSSSLRAFIAQCASAELTEAYNANVQAVADFRSCHLRYAASYINKQGRRVSGNDTDVGTGGTPFMKYLKKHRDETAANMLHVPLRRRLGT